MTQPQDELDIFDDVVEVEQTPVAAKSVASFATLTVVAVLGGAALVTVLALYVWPWAVTVIDAFTPAG